MFQSSLLGQVCDKACDKILESPVIKWVVKIAQVLACVAIMQTTALFWIAASLATERRALKGPRLDL
jgi:hypothetical protein